MHDKNIVLELGEKGVIDIAVKMGTREDFACTENQKNEHVKTRSETS